MANIKIVLDHTIANGMDITFKAPCDCSAVTGLTITHLNSNGTGSQVTTQFQLADAHNNNVGSINELFKSGAYVKVILNTTNNIAYIQNADTNTYLENKFSNHGNHVPTTQTANNAKFLRNDNTWQTVTPANIGAVPKSGTTMTGALMAYGGAVGTAQVRSIYFGTAELTDGSASTAAEGTMYFTYK